MFDVGDAATPFSIQSVSKPFVFALVCDAIGPEAVRRAIGVNATGLPFDSVMAVELNPERTMNPMVNAGAIATTSLVPGATADDKWRTVQEGLSRFAGRDLALDAEVHRSETATDLRSQGIAHLLDGYGRLRFDPDERGHRHHRTGEGRARHLLPAARCGGQQRPGCPPHHLPVAAARARSLRLTAHGLTATSMRLKKRPKKRPKNVYQSRSR